MPSGRVLGSGLVERIGEETGKITHKVFIRESLKEVVIEERIPDHKEGLKKVAALLTDDEFGIISDVSDVKLVGHRVVLGGEKFSSTTEITPQVKEAIERLSVIAPLHNPPNLTGIEVAEHVFPEALQVAVFDTSFHHTLPDYAFRYAIPDYFYTVHGIRVYGFHGTSHKYVAGRAAGLLGKAMDEVNLITIHLGNGSSMAAVKNGKSIDTTLGLTPLAGLVMGTRPGDIDPGVLLYMAGSLGISTGEMTKILNKESGFKGLTGFNDMRIIQEEYEKGNEKARLAIELAAYRIKKYIGAYIAAIGKVDALVFTAGIGENSALMRERATRGLSHLGIAIDNERNNAAAKGERDISSADAKIKTLVIPTNEELEIAMQAWKIFGSK